MSFEFTLTEKGRNLYAKSQVGTVLAFTRFKAGDGVLTTQVVEKMTELINPRLSNIAITSLKSINNQATIGCLMSNKTLQAGFMWREFGLYATDPDQGEILVAYANIGTTPIPVPPASEGTFERNSYLTMIVSSASTVTAMIDESKVYATQQDLTELKVEIIPMLYITDVTTNAKYKWGIENGIAYLEEVEG